MSWKVIAHPDLPIVETIYSGVMTGKEVAEAAAETLRVATSLGRNRLFADCSSLEGGHSTFSNSPNWTNSAPCDCVKQYCNLNSPRLWRRFGSGKLRA